MEVLRTPDSCFEGLPDYPFAPHYADVSDFEGGRLRMHYVDEGPRDGVPVVMIHGNPTWSFMWRKLIPRLTDAGYRAIAIDLIGTGRSDKPTEAEDYTLARHVSWVVAALFERLDIQDAHFVLHDWGGIIGLRALVDHQDRARSITLSNTGLSSRDPDKPIKKMARKGASFMRLFQIMVRLNRNWKPWRSIAKYALSDMPQADVDGFAAAYPDTRYLVAHRRFPDWLPTRNDNPMLAENWAALQKLKSFERPVLCLYSDKDQVAPNGYRSVRPAIPGTRDREPVILEGAGHFLLEDAPEPYADALLSFLAEVDA